VFSVFWRYSRSSVRVYWSSGYVLEVWGSGAQLRFNASLRRRQRAPQRSSAARFLRWGLRRYISAGARSRSLPPVHATRIKQIRPCGNSGWLIEVSIIRGIFIVLVKEGRKEAACPLNHPQTGSLVNEKLSIILKMLELVTSGEVVFLKCALRNMWILVWFWISRNGSLLIGFFSRLR
jgi:hypothetical protein